jgi:hypothetical protein
MRFTVTRITDTRTYHTPGSKYDQYAGHVLSSEVNMKDSPDIEFMQVQR